MHRLLFAMIAAAVLASGPLGAQPVAPPTSPGVTQDPQKMLAELEAAQASASQPGNDALDCDQLQEKFAATADAQVKQAQTAQRVQARTAQGQQFAASLPKLVRGQRLMELAVAQNCAWTAGIVPAPAAAVPLPKSNK